MLLSHQVGFFSIFLSFLWSLLFEACYIMIFRDTSRNISPVNFLFDIPPTLGRIVYSFLITEGVYFLYYDFPYVLPKYGATVTRDTFWRPPFSFVMFSPYFYLILCLSITFNFILCQMRFLGNPKIVRGVFLRVLVKARVVLRYFFARHSRTSVARTGTLSSLPPIWDVCLNSF